MHTCLYICVGKFFRSTIMETRNPKEIPYKSNKSVEQIVLYYMFNVLVKNKISGSTNPNTARLKQGTMD
uniref:Uncharacterized protein n=1 Tax=Octopus bimaculoides TaxID=37653 RepID=A0A0L8GFK7_OCTBM